MNLLHLALIVAPLGGLFALCVSRVPKLANAIGALAALATCVIGMIPACGVLASGATFAPPTLPWHVPYGAFHLEVDALSAWFLAPVFVVGAAAAVYGAAQMAGWTEGRPVGWGWFFFNTLIAALALVFTARNTLLFLAAWEVMSLASFFLIQLDDAHPKSAEASRRYFIAMHLGAAVLFAFFVLLGQAVGPTADGALEFARGAAVAPATGALLFVMALVGFGVKAGVVPLHVWAPDSYSTAPTFAAALMSGVMAKTGVYGILRTLEIVGRPAEWQAWALIAVGVASGVVGALNAAAQNDLKRLLAYSSVENMGVVFLGLGVGVLGLAANPTSPIVAALGFGGALLHVWNDALFKSLLFLASGVVEQATGTTQMDLLGGLLKKIPWLGACFLIGAVAICGLPPLNGFVGEFLIYLGAFDEQLIARSTGGVSALLIIGGLATTGGFAAVCFTKAVGITFLGAPRTDYPVRPVVGLWLMRLPIVALTAACFAAGLLGPRLLGLLEPALVRMTGEPADAVAPAVAGGAAATTTLTVVACVFFGLVVAIALLRGSLLRGREIGESGTWDCGYAAPTARMQFTGSGFTQPVVDFFGPLLQPKKKWTPPEGLFPQRASLETRVDDVAETRVYEPLFKRAHRFLGSFGWLQSGHTNLYVLYVAATVLALLVWFLGTRV